jgi:hypothetical protein
MSSNGMNIKLIKMFDTILWHLFGNLIHSPHKSIATKSLTSILIIRPGGIGDAVLLAPAIISIKKNIPLLVSRFWPNSVTT